MPGSAGCAGTRSTWRIPRSASRSSCSSRPASCPRSRGAPASMGEPRRMLIPVGAAPGRADRWAADLSGLSRSHVQRLISDGRLTVAGMAVKANAILAPGTVLDLDVPPPAPAEPIGQPELPLTIVYEDADLLIVNKPAGQVVHP